MDVEALRQELRDCCALMRAIADTEPPPGAGPDWDLSREECARFDAAEARAAEIRRELEEIETRGQRIMSSTARLRGDDGSGAGFNINRGGDPFDADTIRLDATAADLRARVETGLERDDSTPDAIKVGAMDTLRTVVGDRRQLAVRALVTGGDAYRSAYAKLATGNQALWTDAERQAVARAQSLTDASGGYAVPFTLDPTIVLTNGGALNPIRALARKVLITTNEWNGVTSAGTTASWDAEAAEVSDDSLTLVQPSIPVYKGQIFVPFSVEVGGDWVGIESDLRTAMADAKDRLEATAHLTGSGSGQPTGIQTELDGTSSEIAPATAETFAIGDVYNLQRVLPARARMAGPTWVGSIGTFNKIRQFDTGGGGSLWTQLGDGTPERLLGWAAAEHSEVDDVLDLDAGATADNFVLFVGDWSKYVIVDRVGMTVELIPHLFATGNNRPSGQRGLIGWWRTGAESIDDSSFRVLSIPTTA